MSNSAPRKDSDQDANELLGKAVADLRRRASLTQASLAEEAEMEEREITALERGSFEPTWGDLRRIASALGVPLAELLARAES